MEMGRGCTQDGAGSLIFQMARCLAIRDCSTVTVIYGAYDKNNTIQTTS